MIDWSLVWLLAVFAAVSWALAETMRRIQAERYLYDLRAYADHLSRQLRQANSEVERLSEGGTKR